MPILPEHKEILLTQSESKTLPEWIDFFNNQYNKNQIYCFCHRNGKEIKKLDPKVKSEIQSNNARKYSINKDYFKYWSKDMAYLFGFWFADGCIYNGKMFDITTHAKDKYILNRFKELLQYEGNLIKYEGRQAYRLNFSCVEIYHDIIKLGGKERKSLDCTFPNIPKEFLRDFIRGYFDGDGSIWNVKGKRINSSFCSGSKQFLIKLLEILKQETNIQGGSLHLANASCWELLFGKRDSIILGHYMYDNLNSNLYLQRKFDKFIKYF